MEEVEDDLSQEKLPEDPPEAETIPVTSSRTFDDLVNINFSHLAPSLGITLKGLACLHTLKIRIDPHDQSSTFVATTTSWIPKAPAITASSPPPTNQRGAAT